MPEVAFHTGVADKPGYTCRLLRKAWRQGAQVVVTGSGEQLQRLYYQTVDAGELFFDKLNALEPGQTEVREVYYLCLALGFSGRFCNPGDGILLEQLKTSNLRLIAGSQLDVSTLVNSSLFSGAYQAADSLQHIEKSSGRRFPIEIFAGVGVPALLYGLLFLIYHFILDNVGQNFISMVP